MGLFSKSSQTTLTTTQNLNSSGSGDQSGDQAMGGLRVLTGGDGEIRVQNASTPQLIDTFRQIQLGNQAVFAGALAGQAQTFGAVSGALASGQQAAAGDTLGRLNTTLGAGGVAGIVKTLLPVLGLLALGVVAYFIWGRKKA